MKQIIGVAIVLIGLLLLGSDSANMTIFLFTKVLGAVLFFSPLYLSGAISNKHTRRIEKQLNRINTKSGMR